MTRITPSPSSTSAARASPFCSGLSVAPSARACFLTDSDSPVSADSLSSRYPSISTPSAGTVSPGWSRTRSLTTRSSISTSSKRPLRKVFTLILDASSIRRWNSFSLLNSDHVATIVAITKAIAMPMPSYHGAKPSTASNTVTPSATIRMMMIGSRRLLRSLSKKVSTCCWVRALGPFSRRD